MIDGKLVPFKYDLSKEEREEYKNAEKYSICYIWQFSIEDNFFYGRTLEDFRDFLSELNHYCPFRKICYVHNLSFEFQYLLNIGFPDRVFARKSHKVIYCEYDKFNLAFRCSYMLTRLSLENWTHGKNLAIKKLVEDDSIDYLKIRTPKTVLTEKELYYCRNDVLSMWCGLCEYRKKYEFLWNIPLTQTGEVRRVVQEVMKPEEKYRKTCSKLMPDNLEEYSLLVEVFGGGSTHANWLYSDRVIYDVDSWDISSSYPFTQVVEKFPMSPFIECEYREFFRNNDKYSFIIIFSCREVKSKLFNTFLSKSKCRKVDKCKLDNGRILEADYIEVAMTNVDYEIFLQCYEFDTKSFNIINFYLATNEYLNDTYRRYILETYCNKTKLKNVDGMEAIYHASKEQLNSNYGMAVTKDLTDDIIFNDGEWEKDLLNPSKYADKVRKYKRNISKRVIAYQHGLYVPAYGRRNLWKSIIELDSDVVYFDTDSNKTINLDTDFFIKENERIVALEKKIANSLGVSVDYFAPKDNNGIEHRLGCWDYEGRYQEFKTLGAKKYCYRNGKGELKMTVAGVRKKAVFSLNNDINNFNDGHVFSEEETRKLTLIYDNFQKPVTFNKGEYDEFKSDYKFSIHCVPTTYSLGMTQEYIDLLIENSHERTEIFYE